MSKPQERPTGRFQSWLKENVCGIMAVYWFAVLCYVLFFMAFNTAVGIRIILGDFPGVGDRFFDSLLDGNASKDAIAGTILMSYLGFSKFPGALYGALFCSAWLWHRYGNKQLERSAKWSKAVAFLNEPNDSMMLVWLEGQWLDVNIRTWATSVWLRWAP